jgi:hypothetical protein
MDTLELFVQGEGNTDIFVVTLPGDATGQTFLEQLRAEHGGHLVIEETTQIYLEDTSLPLDPARPLHEHGVTHHSRLHLHRCHQIAVTVHFQARTIEHRFSPAATIATVTAWAVGPNGFALAPVDAAEHALQVCHSTDRPAADVEIGTLVRYGECALCCDLVPKVRVEG